MADNFDSNVARRKPNIAERTRPIHPWDISPDSSQNLSKDTHAPFVLSEEALGPINTEASINTAVPDILPESSLPETVPVSSEPIYARKNDLSDAINIHSNFCKLDNDVTDYLFAKLSPSAQSVYLRLYRQSFGWNRNWAAESLPKLTKSCNLSLQTVRKAIRELEQLGCIRKEFSDYHKATVYRIYLPSEIGMGKYGKHKNTTKYNRRQNNNIPNNNIVDSDMLYREANEIDLNNKPPDAVHFDAFIYSHYFPEIHVANILETGGALPHNVSHYINDTNLSLAVETIDEFYESIGYSIVSRSQYRKSLLDYFDLVKSGFTQDDIRYAVRWTFKNSRSRPDSFSLIKHTMHLAMDDYIKELNPVTDSTFTAEKQEAVRRNLPRNNLSVSTFSAEDMQLWQKIAEDLKNSLNEQSFIAFIQPLVLVEAQSDKVVLKALPESSTWVQDHYLDIIRQAYREKSGREITVTII
ncbi:MAG: DnaA N-terminal domain-containing protein [Candidatus Latescibacter sp.]|nr:DnaA N-terminal domain-containing protein [Candidatus Latescibacter sp.]